MIIINRHYDQVVLLQSKEFVRVWRATKKVLVSSKVEVVLLREGEKSEVLEGQIADSLLYPLLFPHYMS